MVVFKRWCARLGALASALVLTVFVPVAAWAATDTGEIVVEAARRRGGRGIGVFSLFCCLVVIGLVIVAVLLITRGRSRRR